MPSSENTQLNAAPDGLLPEVPGVGAGSESQVTGVRDTDPGPVVCETVEQAQGAPNVEQPFRELGLKDDEYARIRSILGRRPTDTELAMYSVMWSEHCSYKSSKVHLKYFGATTTPEMREALLAGIGENAGVVDIGDGWAVTFKLESHNHPSYVEPYQGAATGVGGIVRDIMAMGARPVAVSDALRFGPADAPDTRRVLPGVVAGVGGYGNCLGLPNIGGEVVFDPSYASNPLVNAMCIGALRTEELQLAHASGAGNKIILLGARTGLDGIGGVSVLASETFEDAEEAGDSDESSGKGSHASSRKKLPSVQVGDPFMEKVLIECCLELYRSGLVLGIQDLGGAGLACATSELASAGDGGMRVWLNEVPLRAQGMTPAEVLCSESQERMCAVVRPDNVDEFLQVCAKWEVPATVIGEVTQGELLEIYWNDELVVEVPPRTVAHEGPVYTRPVRRPSTQDQLQASGPESLRRPVRPQQLRETILQLVSSPNLSSRAWVTDQYDRYVRGNTVLAQPHDGGVLRIDEETGRGIAVATDCNARYTQLDPYAGAQLALAEAYRNVAVTGSKPLAVTNCLNFGSPEDPGVMWQFQQAVQGLAEGCAELGIPVTGGNVSFYNQTGERPILPTPVVGVLGVIDDVTRRIPTALPAESGQSLLLLGETRDEFGGSEWARVVHDHLGGTPPKVDLAAEKLLAEVLEAGSRDGMISAAHDLSEGGLAQALVEAALAGETGARVVLPEGADPFVWLFSESAGRALVAVPRSEELRFTDMCQARQLPCTKIGVVDAESPSLHLQLGEVPSQTSEAPLRNSQLPKSLELSLDELRSAWEGTLPALFG